MEAALYRFVVEGELGPRYARAFENMRVECDHGKTVLTGTMQDQAQLQGLLDRIAALGLELVSVARQNDHEAA